MLTRTDVEKKYQSHSWLLAYFQKHPGFEKYLRGVLGGINDVSSSGDVATAFLARPSSMLRMLGVLNTKRFRMQSGWSEQVCYAPLEQQQAFALHRKDGNPLIIIDIGLSITLAEIAAWISQLIRNEVAYWANNDRLRKEIRASFQVTEEVANDLNQIWPLGSALMRYLFFNWVTFEADAETEPSWFARKARAIIAKLIRGMSAKKSVEAVIAFDHYPIRSFDYEKAGIVHDALVSCFVLHECIHHSFYHPQKQSAYAYDRTSIRRSEYLADEQMVCMWAEATASAQIYGGNGFETYEDFAWVHQIFFCMPATPLLFGGLMAARDTLVGRDVSDESDYPHGLDRLNRIVGISDGYGPRCPWCWTVGY